MSGARATIAYFGGTYPRVSDTFIQREVAGLRALGHSVRTYALRPPPDTEPLSELGRAERRSTDYLLIDRARLAGDLVAGSLRAVAAAPHAWRFRRRGLVGTAYQACYLAEAAALARRFRRDGVGHVHCHYPDASGTVAVLAARLAGITHSLHIHGPDVFWDAGEWRLGDKIASAAFAVCISHYARTQAMLRVEPRHHDRLHIVHCGVDTRGLVAREPRSSIRRLLFIGRLAPAKGLGVLLRALALEQAAGLELDVVGDGPDREGLERLATDLGLTHRVRFLGARPHGEAMALLRDADAFVMSSFAEGVPVVLMEAMASGVPVVAPRIAGIPELIDDGREGLLCTPGDTDGLAAALARLAGDPAFIRAATHAARAKVAREFDGDREVARLASVIDHAVNGIGPRPAVRPEPADAAAGAHRDERGVDAPGRVA